MERPTGSQYVTTLAEALKVASEHWSDRPGGSVQAVRADRCVQVLGPNVKLDALGTTQGVTLLRSLRDAKLSPKSVQDYYGTFRRMLALNGVTTTDWPKAPTPPRVKSREPIEENDLDRLIEWLDAHGSPETADLVRLLRGTGLRVSIEALAEGGLEVLPGPDTGGETPGYATLRITGKGGHERLIPVVSHEARDILTGLSGRLHNLRRLAYRTHLDRWAKGVKALGIKSRLATPHAVRHGYATNALARSGGNLSMVQELLGHADPATTARYLHTDLSAKARVLGLSMEKPQEEHTE